VLNRQLQVRQFIMLPVVAVVFIQVAALLEAAG
jgi:hypothetical protein